MKAREAGVKSIELDVWLTSDNKLVVAHGGDNGELHCNHDYAISSGSTDTSSSHGSISSTSTKKQLYAFNSTLEECRETVQEHCLPTLNQVFDLAGDKMFVNIECKVPYDPEIKKLYNWKLTASKVVDLIKEYDFNEKCYVSSFDTDILEEIISLSQKSGYLVRTSLIGPWDENATVPSCEYLTSMPFNGYNCEYTRVTPELVKTMKEAGKILGSWFDKPIYPEDDKAKEHLYELDVDMVCTDYPLQALNLLHNPKNDLKPESIRKWSFEDTKVINFSDHTLTELFDTQ